MKTKFAAFEARDKFSGRRVTAQPYLRGGNSIMFRLTDDTGKTSTIGEVSFAYRYEGVKA